MISTLFIHMQSTTTVVELTENDVYLVPHKFCGTVSGRPVSEVHPTSPEIDLYLRVIGIGGGRKKKKQLKPPQPAPGLKVATSIGKAIGQMIGKNIGMKKQAGKMGANMAGAAHSFIGNKLKKLIGKGDYALEGSQTSINSLIKGHPSSYSSFGGNHAEMVVEYREYLGDLSTLTVTASTSTTPVGPDTNLFLKAYPINPGIATSFPWLSNIARNYEEYIFDGLVYEFVSTTSPYNQNSAMGEVIITSQDNVTGPALTTRQQLFNTEMCCTARLDKNIMYGIECKRPAQVWYYVNATAAPNTTNPNLNNFANVYFGSQVASTFPSNSVLGEVWVTYRVRFRGPIVVSGSDSALVLTTTTTLPLYTNLPDLRIQPVDTTSGVIGTGIYNVLGGGSNVVFNTGIDCAGFDVATSGLSAALQFNLTRLKKFEVFDLTLTFIAAYNMLYSGDGLPIVPFVVGFPTSFLQYSTGYNGTLGVTATAGVQNPSSLLPGVTMRTIKAQPFTVEPYLSADGNSYVRCMYNYTFQYNGTTSSAPRVLATYQSSTGPTSSGECPFYRTSLLLGWNAENNVGKLFTPTCSADVGTASSDSTGQSSVTIAIRSRGLYVGASTGTTLPTETIVQSYFDNPSGAEVTSSSGASFGSTPAYSPLLESGPIV